MKIQDLKEKREQIIEKFFQWGGSEDKLKVFMEMCVDECEECDTVDELLNSVWVDSLAEGYKQSEKERLLDVVGEMNLNEELEMNEKGYIKNPITRKFQKSNLV